MNVQIEESWKVVLQEEFNKPYFHELVHHIKTRKKEGHVVYPPGPDIFNAFRYTPFHEVKVLLLGQDPYHGPNQAHGLCFSVQEGIAPPPSVQNIFKELKSDIGKEIPTHSNLTSWAQQGVLMLNASLTVEAGQPMSHSKIGWEQFTDRVIQLVSEKLEGVVFILWGRFAQEKEKWIDATKHCVLKSAHPSPFSAYQGFFGCKHFSLTNAYLQQLGKAEIRW